MNNHGIQTRLKELGLYTGRIDGDIGPKSKTAIRAFQRINGLKQDGIIGPKTLAALFPAPIPERDVDPPHPVGLEISPWPRQADVERFYGTVGKNQTLLDLPYTMWLAWDLRKSVKRISLHEKVAASAGRVFERVLDHYGAELVDKLDLDVFGGSLNVRKMRGGSRWSMHSWGIAIDIDPAHNQLTWGKDKASLANPEYDKWWDLWEEEGWLSLGRARNMDWMHVQGALL